MKVKRRREKSCQRCEQQCDSLYRVRYQENRNWVFLCNACLNTVRPDNTLYQYGGTWKSKKRH